MLQVRTQAIKLRCDAAFAISGTSASSRPTETEMRHLETLTGGLFAVATIVLAVEAMIAF